MRWFLRIKWDNIWKEFNKEPLHNRWSKFLRWTLKTFLKVRLYIIWAFFSTFFINLFFFLSYCIFPLSFSPLISPPPAITTLLSMSPFCSIPLPPHLPDFSCHPVTYESVSILLVSFSIILWIFFRWQRACTKCNMNTNTKQMEFMSK